MGLIFGHRGYGSSPRAVSLHGLIGYADNNFAGVPEDRKSVIGYYFFISGAVVSWSSKKHRLHFNHQSIIHRAWHAAKDAVGIRRFINELVLEVVENVILHDDNEMSITLTKMKRVSDVLSTLMYKITTSGC